jgi:hypothetical protein
MKPSHDSGARRSETHYRADAANPARPPAAPEDPAAQALLELVLQQTMAAYAQMQGAGTQVTEALRAVADEYAGASLSFEPCLVALVSAAIREPFASWVPEGPTWDALCRKVAQTMYDDPNSRARLETLWVQLQEARS